ncbi:MAG: hypothetical protein N2C14_12270, partial [Planctomycetales bacterium]
MRRHCKQSRDGALLIVVLGLLALFALVMVTFVMTAEQHSSGSLAAAREEQRNDPYDVLLERAMVQILSGTNDRFSVIGQHGLLEDMYGPPSAVAPIPANGFADSDATFVIGSGEMMAIGNLPTGVGAFSTFPGYYNGQVITMVSGAAEGQSSRITGYGPDPSFPGMGRLHLLPFKGMTLQGGGWSLNKAPQPGDVFVINGRAFSGTGFGYSPDTPTLGLLNAKNATDPVFPLDPKFDGYELALTPNPRSLAVRQYLYGGNFPISANEDYDAVDYQNMLLSLYVSTPGGNFVHTPSLHRPALINYWNTRVSGFGGLGLPREAALYRR